MESRKVDARGWWGISCPRPSTTATHGALLPPRNGLGTTVWAVDRAGNRQSRSSACKITYTVSLCCWFQLRFKASEFSLEGCEGELGHGDYVQTEVKREQRIKKGMEVRRQQM